MQTDRLLRNADKTHKMQTGREQGTICTQEKVEKADNTTYRDPAGKTHSKRCIQVERKSFKEESRRQ